MSKAILILDEKPITCWDCPCHDNEFDVCKVYHVGMSFDFDDCPLMTEEQYIDRVYPVLYNMVVRGILFQKELAKRVSAKSVGEEE